jgi:hypothetical protein
MKPPFWEVTVRRQAALSQPPVIESVNCFPTEREAENYRSEVLSKDVSLRVTIRLVIPEAHSAFNMRRSAATL